VKKVESFILSMRKYRILLPLGMALAFCPVSSVSVLDPPVFVYLPPKMHVNRKGGDIIYYFCIQKILVTVSSG
jgi:hypothetical protein